MVTKKLLIFALYTLPALALAAEKPSTQMLPAMPREKTVQECPKDAARRRIEQAIMAGPHLRVLEGSVKECLLSTLNGINTDLKAVMAGVLSGRMKYESNQFCAACGLVNEDAVAGHVCQLVARRGSIALKKIKNQKDLSAWISNASSIADKKKRVMIGKALATVDFDKEIATALESIFMWEWQCLGIKSAL